MMTQHLLIDTIISGLSEQSLAPGHWARPGIPFTPARHDPHTCLLQHIIKFDIERTPSDNGPTHFPDSTSDH